MKIEKGITLIALVITIIILLILAGVTISLTLGNNGILKISETAVEKQKIAEYQDKIELSKATALGNNEGTIVLDDLINQIYKDNIVADGNITKIDEERAKLITDEGYEFIITTDKIEYLADAIKISKEIVSIDGNYINILVTIEDEKHGIKEVVKPDGTIISSDNKTKISIDYKVEEAKEYIFKITNGEGKIKNEVISVNIPKESGIRLNGGTAIITNLAQSDIYNTVADEYTIAMRVKINRSEQASVYYMGLWGMHTVGGGTYFQFSRKWN